MCPKWNVFFLYTGYCSFSKWKLLLLSVTLPASIFVAEKVDSLGILRTYALFWLIQVALVDGFCCCLWLCQP